MKLFRLITVNDSPDSVPVFAHQTPRYLYEMGMCLCDTCGKLHSIDYKFCNECFREIFVDIKEGEKSDDAKIK